MLRLYPLTSLPYPHCCHPATCVTLSQAGPGAALLLLVWVLTCCTALAP
jgi:hypothetical protein